MSLKLGCAGLVGEPTAPTSNAALGAAVLLVVAHAAKRMFRGSCSCRAVIAVGVLGAGAVVVLALSLLVAVLVLVEAQHVAGQAARIGHGGRQRAAGQARQAGRQPAAGAAA